MAHPDDGYAIPDEEWQGKTDPETGENLYPDDEFAARRLKLIQAQMEQNPAVQRTPRGPRHELERLRKNLDR